MHYNWELILAPGETLKKEFGLSRRVQTTVLITAVVLNLLLAFANIVLAIFVFFLGAAYYWYLITAKHFALTDKRLIIVNSFLELHITSVDYFLIKDVLVKQNPLGSVGGWGNIIIQMNATNERQNPDVTINLVDHPQEIKKLIEDGRNAGKQPT